MRPASAMSDFDANPVAEEEITFHSTEPARGRIYHPIGIAHSEPSGGGSRGALSWDRGAAAAAICAGAGLTRFTCVLTPQVDELADYKHHQGLGGGDWRRGA